MLLRLFLILIFVEQEIFLGGIVGPDVFNAFIEHRLRLLSLAGSLILQGELLSGWHNLLALLWLQATERLPVLMLILVSNT